MRKKSKNKRNILRDPNDKRSGLKKISTDAYANDSKKRGSIKKSLDSRINGQNILQISNKKMFNQKSEIENIVTMNDSKLNNAERAPTQQMQKRRSTNMRNNQFENCISDNANSKINYSDMYSNYNFSKPITSNDKRVARKRTTRPLKNRKFKKQSINRRCDSVRDINSEVKDKVLAINASFVILNIRNSLKYLFTLDIILGES